MTTLFISQVRSQKRHVKLRAHYPYPVQPGKSSTSLMASSAGPPGVYVTSCTALPGTSTVCPTLHLWWSQTCVTDRTHATFLPRLTIMATRAPARKNTFRSRTNACVSTCEVEVWNARWGWGCTRSGRVLVEWVGCVCSVMLYYM